MARLHTPAPVSRLHWTLEQEARAVRIVVFASKGRRVIENVIKNRNGETGRRLYARVATSADAVALAARLNGRG